MRRVMARGFGVLTLVSCFTDSGTNPGAGPDDGSTSGTSTGSATSTASAMSSGMSSTVPASTSDTAASSGASSGPECTIWEQLVSLEAPEGGYTFDPFPIPVPIPFGEDTIYDVVGDPATDIRFYDPDTDTALPFEVDTWEPGGESLLWIGVPFGEEGLAVVIMRYGDPDPPPNDPTAVWDERFLGVWHLSATEDGTARDSTRNGLHGQPSGEAANGFAEGRLGGGWATEADKDHFGVPEPLLAQTSVVTIEAWVSPTNTVSAGPGIHRVPAGRGTDYQLIAVHSGSETPAFGATVDGVQYAATDPARLTGAVWTHLAGTFGNDGIAIHVDGAPPSTSSQVGSLATAGPTFTIGGGNFRGSIDEVRISSDRRSNAWVRTQYRMMEEDRVTLGDPSPACD